MHLAVETPVGVNRDNGVRVQMKKSNRQLLCNAAALGILLATPILDVTAATVEVPADVSVEDSPFREPLDTSSRNVTGSDAVGDKRGGTSALILALSSAKEKATVEYTVGNTVNTLDDVIALGVVYFDIYTEIALSGATGGAAFKVKCGNTSISAEINYPAPLGWSTVTIDLNSAGFSRGAVTQTLEEWKKPTSGWCQGFSRVQAFQVGIGTAGFTPTSDYNVYLDYFQFGASADIYNFELSNGTDLIDVPEAPNSLSAEAGDGFAVISFKQPDGSDNGAAITNYSWSDGGAYNVLAPPDNTTSITIPSLTNGQQYSITLKAINSEGASDASNAVSVTPLATEILPAAPVITSVEPGDKQITINFTQPSVSGEGEIQDYTLRVAGLDDPISTAQTQSPITVPGATNGTTYSVSIAAKNSDGIGPDSNQAIVTLPLVSVLKQVPVLPLPALLVLLGLVAWYSRRRLTLQVRDRNV